MLRTWISSPTLSNPAQSRLPSCHGIRCTVHGATLHKQAKPWQFAYFDGGQQEELVMVIGGFIDLILDSLLWEASGWRVWEIKCGNKVLLNGSNRRLPAATLRQRTGLDLALIDTLSCCTFSTGRHRKDRAGGWLQRKHDNCLATCSCIPTVLPTLTSPLCWVW